MTSFVKRIRIFFWTSQAFFKKYSKLIGFSLLIGLVAFFLVTKIVPFLPKPKKHLRIGLIGNYTQEQLPYNVLKYLGQGLTSIGDDGSAASGLASNWMISEDGLTYTFFIKDDIYWQDGSSILASDIVYDFQDVERRLIDEKTLEFKLKEPFSPFPIALSTPIFKKRFIGSGKYRVDRIKKQGDYVEFIKLSGPEKDISFKFYPTVETLKLGFKLGEVDVIDGLFINPFDDNWKRVLDIETTIKKDRYIGLFFNNIDPFLGNKNLRQSLNYAIESKPTDEKRALSPISPDSWAYNKSVKSYEYDASHAQELLEKFKEDDDEEIKLKISTSQAFLSLADEIKRSWEETLGIIVDVEVIDSIQDDFQIFLGIQEIPADPDQYVLWHSTRSENITHFNDPRVDKLLEDARKIQDIEERKEKYFEFQKFLNEESPVAFLSHPVIYKISRKSFF